MKRRVLALLLVLAIVACAAIGLAACNEGGKDGGGGAGDRIFTQDASLDDIIAALKNAESFTREFRVTATIINTGEASGYYYIATAGKTATYELVTGEFNAEGHKSDAAKFIKDGEIYWIDRRNWIYDEISDDYIITDEMVPESIEKNLVSNSDPVLADEYIITLSELLTEEDGKIVPKPEIMERADDIYLRLEGDKLVIGWSHQYSNNTGTYRDSIEYVYSKVNATDVVIPEEVKALAYEAEWADYVSYNGVSYLKAEDEYGEFYIAYHIQDGAVPEETINGLPVRER